MGDCVGSEAVGPVRVDFRWSVIGNKCIKADLAVPLVSDQ